jgi:transcription antitermination factor NusG
VISSNSFQPFTGEFSPGTPEIPCSTGKRWYAVSTLAKHEKSVVRHLDARNVESFLPTHEVTRKWKNRQTVRTILPLFPTYLFVHICEHERVRVLGSPGVTSILGNGHGPIPVPTPQIEMLRAAVLCNAVSSYAGELLGQRVVITGGVMNGLQGTLVRTHGGLHLVFALESINQMAAVEVKWDHLFPAGNLNDSGTQNERRSQSALLVPPNSSVRIRPKAHGAGS